MSPRLTRDTADRQSGGRSGLDRLRQFAPNTLVRHADFSPLVRRESFSALDASNQNARNNTALPGTTQKGRGPALRRPSAVNQKVAGSSPARGANYFSTSATPPRSRQALAGSSALDLAGHQQHESAPSKQDSRHQHLHVERSADGSNETEEADGSQERARNQAGRPASLPARRR
jgi:hypothetical protein